METLGWQTRRSLKDMCDDAWRWQQYANTLINALV